MSIQCLQDCLFNRLAPIGKGHIVGGSKPIVLDNDPPAAVQVNGPLLSNSRKHKTPDNTASALQLQDRPTGNSSVMSGHQTAAVAGAVENRK